MRHLLIILLVVSILLPSTVRSGQKSIDFSGKWRINREMSDFGTGRDGKKRNPRSSTMEIEQSLKELKVTMIRTGRDGKEQKTKLKYSLEGNRTENKTDFGKQESTAKWLEDGQALEISSSMHTKRGDMEFDVESVQKWTLAEGRLVIESIRSTPRGEMKTKAVYDREIQ